jgi:hypothetical protein
MSQTVSRLTWRTTPVRELFYNISVSGVRASASGFPGPDNLSQFSLGSSRNYEREQDPEPAVLLPRGPIPRANPPSKALTPQDTASLSSRFQIQSIPSSSGNTRLSDAYGGTTTSTRVSSGPRPTTPSRDQARRHGPIPGTPSSRPRGLAVGPRILKPLNFPLHLDPKD